MKNKILPAYLIIATLLLSFTGYQLLIPVLPNDSNTWFSASGKCTQCHNSNATALRDNSGNDVSPVSQWRSTMLANATKLRYFPTLLMEGSELKGPIRLQSIRYSHQTEGR
jgi:hypothetical protein